MDVPADQTNAQEARCVSERIGQADGRTPSDRLRLRDREAAPSSMARRLLSRIAVGSEGRKEEPVQSG